MEREKKRGEEIAEIRRDKEKDGKKMELRECGKIPVE